MKRLVKLSEMVNELQNYLNENGDCEIESIAVTSGEGTSYKFYIKNEDLESLSGRKFIPVKCLRNIERR